MKSITSIVKGALAVLLLAILVYVAILFTGVGDTTVYKYTGHDITGNAKEAYHNETKKQDMLLREKIAKMPKTTVEVDSAKYDFGEIKQGDKVEHTYKLLNTGDKDLIISRVKVGCGCTVADYTKEPIPVGSSGDVSIVFDSGDKVGHTEKAMHVYTNTERTPMTLSFVADITKP